MELCVSIDRFKEISDPALLETKMSFQSSWGQRLCFTGIFQGKEIEMNHIIRDHEIPELQQGMTVNDMLDDDVDLSVNGIKVLDTRIY